MKTKLLCLCGRPATGVVVLFHPSNSPNHQYDLAFTTQNNPEGCCSFFEGRFPGEQFAIDVAQEISEINDIPYLGVF